MKSIFVPALSNALCHKRYNSGSFVPSPYDFKFFTEQSFFQYPYVLASTYYQLEYGINNFREYFGYPESYTLIADSGGFQMLTFAKSGKPIDVTPIQILRWMEDNADIGMNLDIPPADNFSSALKQSIENFDYFEKNRLNYSMKLYNVLHGGNLEQINEWYKSVKSFEFDGWALGIKPTNNVYLQVLGYLALREFGEDLTNCHFFGVSSVRNMLTIAYLSNYFNSKITFDSSSYDAGSRFKKFYFPKSVRYSIDFGRNNQKTLRSIPCNCPVCSKLQISDYYGDTEYSYMTLPLHNLYQFSEVNRMINCIVSDDYAFMKYCKSVDEYNSMKILENMLKDSEKLPISQLYEKYKQFMILSESSATEKNLFGVL